jgi:hypothetical protein
MTPEAAAESICAIVKNSGEDGKTMMRHALWRFFERKHGSVSEEDFAEGVNLAVSDGRLRATEVQVWLLK